ncbi:MAG TPA: glycine oxidase ThiO [Pyrinomonadaceae bacterium]|jgi:glycine oxidase
MRNEELSGRKTTDVLVVGGGVIGLGVARELGRRGLSVALVERGRVGAEASDAAAGMLAPQSEANRDDEFFRLQCASRDMYPSFAAALAEESGIDVELDRTGTLYVALTAHDETELEKRHAWQTRAGFAVERLTNAEARLLEPHVSPEVRLALRFPSDWQVENRRLVAALKASVGDCGVRTFADTEVTGVCVARGRVAGVETTRGFFAAGTVVVAAGAWSSSIPFAPSSDSPFSSSDFASSSPDDGHAEHPRIEPVRGQMLCYESRPPLVRHVVYSPRGYIVPRRDGRLLAGSTTESVGFQKTLTTEGTQAIASAAHEIAPAVGGLRLKDAWAGLRPCAADEWPVIGASEAVGGLVYATAHYRNGILLAPLTAEVVAEIIINGTPRGSAHMLEAFSPERFRRIEKAVGSHQK